MSEGAAMMFSLFVKALGVFLVTFLCIKLVNWIIWYKEFFKFFNSIPGETDFHPLWGNIHKVLIYKQRTILK